MLDNLPDDVLLIILTQLECAKDIRALLLTNRRINALVQIEDEGWRVFVRSCLPSLVLPPSAAPSSSSSLLTPSSSNHPKWHEIASSLTWQSRAWSRRSLSFRAMLPIASRRGRAGARQRHQVPFHPVLDAHYDFSEREELVVWGAGENLVGRRRRTKPGSTYPDATTWHRLDGKDIEYVPGYDDIKAVSLVEDVAGRKGDLGVLVGRDNGHLTLLDASERSFGEQLADFSPDHAAEEAAKEDEEASTGPKLHQGTINSVDILARRRLVAATTKAGVFLYPLPEDAGVNVPPSTYLDLTKETFEHPGITLGNARWMGEDMMALGLQGCRDPLRYVTLTPTGFEDVAAATNSELEDSFDISYSKSRLCAGSLTPVDVSSITGGGSKLLLSAWRDGTVRLQDMRSPSPFDLVYCDNIDPWSEFESLLPFGTSHFVGGGVHGATIKVFDFRWSREYYHTAAMPCGSDKPFPIPQQPFLARPPALGPGPGQSRCDHVAGVRCRWHELSRDLYYRPNATFFFSKSLPRENAYAGVWSMARASSVSPNFYVGISGGVVEANLTTSPTTISPDSPQTQLEVDPNFGCSPTGPRDLGAGYMSVSLDASLMETGDGLMSKHNDRNVRMPPMRGKGWSRMNASLYEGLPADSRTRHRLDGKYQVLTDFDVDFWKGVGNQGWVWGDEGALFRPGRSGVP